MGQFDECLLRSLLNIIPPSNFSNLVSISELFYYYNEDTIIKIFKLIPTFVVSCRCIAQIDKPYVKLFEQVIDPALPDSNLTPTELHDLNVVKVSLHDYNKMLTYYAPSLFSSLSNIINRKNTMINVSG
jgi:hypothetical protein